jgi:glycosyltransferase involved in cell wall biosynthesis
MMPVALLEAMASGLPCVVNRQPVVEWMIGPGGEAIDMEPGVLAEAMRGLLCQADRRQSRGAAAHRHCLEHFSEDRVVDRILDYYQFVLTHDSAARTHRPEQVATEPAR